MSAPSAYYPSKSSKLAESRERETKNGKTTTTDFFLFVITSNGGGERGESQLENRSTYNALRLCRW
jgi:hypothetical protein